MTNQKEINMGGIIVPVPEKASDPSLYDPKCPFTGNLKVRGRNFIGIVVAKDTHRTATVVKSSKQFNKKYERYSMKRTKLRVHNPLCIDAHVGDRVRIFETRKLSKTKNFVIVQNFGSEKEFLQKQERIEQDKKQIERKDPEKKESKKHTEAEE